MAEKKRLSVAVFDDPEDRACRRSLYDELGSRFDLYFQQRNVPKFDDLSKEVRKADRFLIYLHPGHVNPNNAKQFRQRLEGYEEKSVFMSVIPQHFQEPAKENNVDCVYLANSRNSGAIIDALVDPTKELDKITRARQHSSWMF